MGSIFVQQIHNQKRNIDGSALGCPGHAGTGIIIRTKDKKFVKAATAITDNNYAELKACHLGWKFAIEMNPESVRLEMDSNYVFIILTGFKLRLDINVD